MIFIWSHLKMHMHTDIHIHRYTQTTFCYTENIINSYTLLNVGIILSFFKIVQLINDCANQFGDV